MKTYMKAIIICGIILLLFPFIALPEFWEHFFVTIPAFIILYSILKIARELRTFSVPEDQEEDLQGYLNKAQERFTTPKRMDGIKHTPNHEETTTTFK